MQNIDIILNEIRKDFYRYRNGAVAETLRKSDPTYRNIFGLILPQLSEIASKYGKNNDLAMALWRRKECREDRLLALYLFELRKLDRNFVASLINDLSTGEEADMLSFKILRFLPEASSLLEDREKFQIKDGILQQKALNMLKKSLDNH